jgi:hypothetical protein
MLAPILLAVVLLTGFFALVPARRLYLGGHPTGVVAAYFLAVWLLGIAAFEARGRFFVPLLLILYVVPFITWRAGLERLLGRSHDERNQPGPAPKNVTPPDNDSPSASA